MPADALARDNRFEVSLIDAPDDGERAATVRRIEAAGDDRALFGPRTPRIVALGPGDGGLRLSLDAGGEPSDDVHRAVVAAIGHHRA